MTTLLAGATFVALGVTVFIHFDQTEVESQGLTIDCGSVHQPELPGLAPALLACMDRLEDSTRARDNAAIIAVVGALATTVVVSVPRRERRELELRGERVIVRSVRPADAGAIATTIDGAMREAHGWTEEHGELLIHQVASGDPTTIVVVTDLDHHPIGAISAMQMTTRDQTVEIGFWLGPEARGRGLMHDAVDLFVPALFEAGWTAVVSETDVYNSASRSVLESARFAEVGRARRRLPDGTDVQAVEYVREATPPARTRVWEPPATGAR